MMGQPLEQLWAVPLFFLVDWLGTGTSGWGQGLLVGDRDTLKTINAYEKMIFDNKVR
jgi:hypothetical protein